VSDHCQGQDHKAKARAFKAEDKP